MPKLCVREVVLTLLQFPFYFFVGVGLYGKILKLNMAKVNGRGNHTDLVWNYN